MVASLLRTLHSGAQDARLLAIKGQPSIDFFTTVFRRAGRFTSQWVRLDFDYRPILGQQAGLTIPRKGHLLSRLYLVTTLPNIRQYQEQAAVAATLPAPNSFFIGPGITEEGRTFTLTDPAYAEITGMSSTVGYGGPCYFEFSIPNIERYSSSNIFDDVIRVSLTLSPDLSGSLYAGSLYSMKFTNKIIPNNGTESSYIVFSAPTVNLTSTLAYPISNYMNNRFCRNFDLSNNDIYRIEYDGTFMNFYRNGVASVSIPNPYTNSQSASPLYAQVDFLRADAQITVLNFGVLAPFVGPRFNYTNNVGHAIIAGASIDIAGSRVENLDGQLLEVMDEFYTPLEKTTVVNSLLQRYDNGFNVDTISGGTPTVVTPLPFWFSRGDSGVFLPIDAIQADPVRLNVNFAPLTNLYISSAQQTFVASGSTAAGAAYFPLLGSPFYREHPDGAAVKGLKGDPNEVVMAFPIPGVSVPLTLDLGDTYVIAEYIYLDKAEANRFRISDIQVPIVQHYKFEPFDTRTFARIQIPLRVPNPTRALFFYAQRYEATAYNAPFLATRDLSGVGTSVPWWPDASGLNTYYITNPKPAFSTRNSEPFAGMSLVYEGKYVRYKTEAPVNFRVAIPAMEMRKTPWMNRYMYTMPFGYNQGRISPSLPSGEANLDKMHDIYLNLVMHPRTGSAMTNDVDGFMILIWAETYNILRVYGGRAGLMMGY